MQPTRRLIYKLPVQRFDHCEPTRFILSFSTCLARRGSLDRAFGRLKATLFGVRVAGLQAKSAPKTASRVFSHRTARRPVAGDWLTGAPPKNETLLGDEAWIEFADEYPGVGTPF